MLKNTPMPDLSGILSRLSSLESNVNNMWSKIYPIGSIYISLNTSNPKDLFGGTWERLPDGKALWTTSSNAGSSIDAGLPNITGLLDLRSYDNKPAHGNNTNVSGAFVKGSTTNNVKVFECTGNANQNGLTGGITFNASNSNSIYGKSNTVQPPAYTVYAWRRTA